MAKLTAAEFQQKHLERTRGARQAMIDGINRVSEAPGVKAASQAQKMLNNIRESVESGLWGERVSSVSLEEWKAAMRDKGVDRVGTGLEKSAPKVIDFAQQLLSYQDSYLPGLRGMSDLTLDDGRQRMLANFEAMSRFRKR